MATSTIIADPVIKNAHTGSVAPVKGSFRYWGTRRVPGITEPFDIVNGKTADVKTHTTNVHDIRPELERYTLDSHAFQIFNHRSAFLPSPPGESGSFDFEDKKQVKDKYWPELRATMKTRLGARMVMSYDSATRTSSHGPHAPGTTQPFHIVHNDLSPPGARDILRCVVPSFFEDLGIHDTTTPEEREQFFRLHHEVLASEERDMMAADVASHKTWDGANYSGPRWAVFSVWRPLETVQNDPLALLDSNTLFSDADFGNPYTNDGDHDHACLAMNIAHEKRPGFIPRYIHSNLMPYLPRDGKEHRWLWVSEQQHDEVLALKLFDSEAWKEAGRHISPCVAHSAFALADPETRPPRRSVEVRMFVVW